MFETKLLYTINFKCLKTVFNIMYYFVTNKFNYFKMRTDLLMKTIILADCSYGSYMLQRSYFDEV